MRDGGSAGGRAVWLVAAVVLVLVGVVVPYGILGGGTPGWGVTVFWFVFGLAVIALVAIGTARWRG